jgi:hypothetical protein
LRRSAHSASHCRLLIIRRQPIISPRRVCKSKIVFPNMKLDNLTIDKGNAIPDVPKRSPLASLRTHLRSIPGNDLLRVTVVVSSWGTFSSRDERRGRNSDIVRLIASSVKTAVWGRRNAVEQGLYALSRCFYIADSNASAGFHNQRSGIPRCIIVPAWSRSGETQGARRQVQHRQRASRETIP